MKFWKQRVAPVTVAVAAQMAATCTVSAQTNTPESEPNESKSQRTSVTGMASGDTISGACTSPGDGVQAQDYFKIQTAAASSGLYVHTLAVSPTDQTAFTEFVELRGRSQSACNINTSSDVEIQLSGPSSPDPSTVRWYGFGQQEEVFVRIRGSSSTSLQSYQGVLSTTTVTPSVATNSVFAGEITLTATGTAMTASNRDLDIWLYDSSFSPIMGGGNDDFSGATDPSLLTLSLAAGTYYLAVARDDLKNNQASNCSAPNEDLNQSGRVTDFSYVLVGSRSSVDESVSVAVAIENAPLDSAASASIALVDNVIGEVIFVQFTVVDSGACCRGSTCTRTSAAMCAGANTHFAGANTVCNVFGVNNSTPCCLGDFNQSGTVSVQDIFDFETAYFSSDSSADINASGSLSVQDILDFLTAYFGGC